MSGMPNIQDVASTIRASQAWSDTLHELRRRFGVEMEMLEDEAKEVFGNIPYRRLERGTDYEMFPGDDTPREEFEVEEPTIVQAWCAVSILVGETEITKMEWKSDGVTNFLRRVETELQPYLLDSLPRLRVEKTEEAKIVRMNVDGEERMVIVRPGQELRLSPGGQPTVVQSKPAKPAPFRAEGQPQDLPDVQQAAATPSRFQLVEDDEPDPEPVEPAPPAPQPLPQPQPAAVEDGSARVHRRRSELPPPKRDRLRGVDFHIHHGPEDL